MVVTSAQMRAAEEAAFASGATAAELMEEAGAGMARAVAQFLPRRGQLVLYLGKGNNAGDALVLARHLGALGWKLAARLAFPESEFKELPARHWKELKAGIAVLDSADEIARAEGPVLLVDGLFGIGAEGAPRGRAAELIREMNALRRSRHAVTVALDLPSGLEAAAKGESGECVEADCTLTVGLVKEVLLGDAAANAVGRLALIPLRDLEDAKGDAARCILTSELLLPMLPRRPFDFHKGAAGRVGIVAGSRGFLGAAVLAATGALRGGAGLVTLCVKEEVYGAVAALAPPEVMVRPLRDYRELIGEKFDALALGPGLGRAADDEVMDLARAATGPVVLDADALNALAARGLSELERMAGPRLLTPHPGEMARLIEGEAGWAGLGRAALSAAFVERFPNVTLLLKGSRTVITTRGRSQAFNTTGHPGMATGGMGDVLTGLVAALAAQGAGLHEAACLGVWLSGRAAELALRDGRQSAESLAAGDVAAWLGAAFTDLKALAF